MLRLERLKREIERILTNRWISLRLDSWGIGLEGVHLVAECLTDAENNITWLNLYGNGLGDEGIQILARALMHPNNKVNVLGLWDNNISDDGARILAHALENVNCCVSLLDIQDNNVTGEGVRSIVRAVRRRPCLETVMLPGTISSNLTVELKRTMRVSNSNWCKVIVALLSARLVPRLSSHSMLKAFPKELVRSLSAMVSTDLII